MSRTAVLRAVFLCLAVSSWCSVQGAETDPVAPIVAPPGGIATPAGETVPAESGMAVPAVPSAPPADRPVPVLDTLWVEAERLALDPMRVPAASTLISAAEWRSARLGGLDEALEEIPGVLARSRSGGSDVRVTIRGFGARGAGERSNAGTTRGIRVTLDGFPLTEPDGRTSLDLADLGLMDAVRVVRSNTSGLFGPASGGLIDLYSASKFDTPFLETSAQFGSFGYSRQQVEAGLRSGASRIKLSVSTGNFDGWRTHSGGAQTTVLASLQAEPSPATEIGLFLAGTRNLQRQAGALTEAEYEADPRGADPAYVLQNARRDNSIGRAGVQLKHRIAEGGFVQVGGFLEPKTIHRSERGRFRDFQRIHTGGSLVGSMFIPAGAARIRWLSGIDEAYQDGSVLFYDLGPGGVRGTNLVANKREGINTFGGFTELSLPVRQRWELSAGLRWDVVHFIYEDHQSPQLDDSRSLRRASPRAAVSFRWRRDQSLYAALSSGIETPAFNEIDPPAPWDTLTGLNPFLKPAYSFTYEIGAKGRVGFGRGTDLLRYDVALYTLQVDNEIVPWNGGAFYRTAGRSRRSGVECGLAAGTDQGLSGRLALTLSRNRYVDYETGTPDAGGDLVVVRYDDNQSAGIPGTALDAALRYGLRAGPYVEVAYHRSGSYFADDANTDRVPAFGILDATIGVTRPAGPGEIGVFLSGRNLTDQKYVASSYVNGVGGRYLEPGMERNVLLGLRVKVAGGL